MGTCRRGQRGLLPTVRFLLWLTTRMQGMFSQPAGRRVVIVVASLVVLCGPGASAYQETVVANGGRIVGTVRVAGDITPLPPQPVFKEKEFCSESVPDERLLVDPAGHLAGAG